jgi:hypothetical protein
MFENFPNKKSKMWCTSVIPPQERLRQEDHKFKTNMGYTVRPKK